jgi:hypothetical protein
VKGQIKGTLESISLKSLQSPIFLHVSIFVKGPACPEQYSQICFQSYKYVVAAIRILESLFFWQRWDAYPTI